MLSEAYLQIKNAADANPVIAGALSLYGLAVLTYMLREVPKKLLSFLGTQCTTRLYLNNSGWGAGPAYFRAFSLWVAENNMRKWSRSYSVSQDSRPDSPLPKLAPGYGTHFFVYKGRLYWLHKSKLESSGSENQKEELVLTTLGRNVRVFDGLLDRFNPCKGTDGHLAVQTYDGGWQLQGTIKKRPIDSVILAPEVKGKLMRELNNFFAHRDWYLEKGLPHKLTCVLHGEPGTGKTSIIKAIASHFDLDLHILNVSSLTDTRLSNALRNVPPKSLVLLEDFDSSSAFKSRSLELPGGTIDYEASESFSLSSILNSLDGIISLDNTLIFLTTNHLEHIDPAVLRKGRTDLLLEVGKLESDQVKEYVKYNYPDVDVGSLGTLKPMLGCDLHDMLRTHLDDGDAFVADLLRRNLKDSRLRSVSNA